MESEVSPIKRIRIREGQSLEAFGRSVGCHLQAVYLNECGTYPHILPAIRRYLEKQGYNVRELDEEYHEFQVARRIAAGAKHKVADVELGEPGNGIHPFTLLQKQLGMSRMAFSKAFAIHPAFLYKLSRAEAHGLSSQMKQALLEAGFRPSVIEELDYRCAEYAESNSSVRAAS